VWLVTASEMFDCRSILTLKLKKGNLLQPVNAVSIELPPIIDFAFYTCPLQGATTAVGRHYRPGK